MKKSITQVKSEIVENYKVEFNKVLVRMYNLEILPDIQMKVKERIPQGGFRIFKNDDLDDFISQSLDQLEKVAREETIEEIRNHAGFERSMDESEQWGWFYHLPQGFFDKMLTSQKTEEEHE